MKTNSKFIFFLILFGSLATGILSCLLAYKLGSASLQAVKSPEENPAQKLALKNLSSANSAQNFKVMKEKDILVKVYNSVYTQKQVNKEKKK